MVKPLRYNNNSMIRSYGGGGPSAEQSNKPYSSLYCEDESLFKVDTKLYTKEELEEQQQTASSYESPFFSMGQSFESALSLAREEQDDSFAFIEFGKESSSSSTDPYHISPRKIERNVAPPKGHFVRRTIKKKNHCDDKGEEKALNFNFNFQTKRLGESKRNALKAFYNNVRGIESNLKQPLHVYLKENEGKGFIGKFSNATNSFKTMNQSDQQYDAMDDHPDFQSLRMMERDYNPVGRRFRGGGFGRRRMINMRRLEEEEEYSRYVMKMEEEEMVRRMEVMENYPGMRRFTNPCFSQPTQPTFSISPTSPDSPHSINLMDEDSPPLDMSTSDEQTRDFFSQL